MDDAYAAFRDDLLGAGLLTPTGVDGLYGRSAAYYGVVSVLHVMIARLAAGESPTEYHFPPILPRWIFAKTNYLESFPDLMGSVHVFHGDSRQHAELLKRVQNDGDWQALLDPADVVLASAACHPLYPLCTGRLGPDGKRFEVYGYCFRHEPAIDPARMQAFQMHEVVYVGDPDGATKHRDMWLERGLGALADLGLEVSDVPANDPFFGRLGTMLATNQLEEGLKIEVITPICSTEQPTAIMSANCHRDHFGDPFAIESADGAVADSACAAFGVDRITLALLHTHGLDPESWPGAVRRHLWP